MTISDLAAAMAPHLDHHVIGIRPGEKLHEILLTADDSRTALELDDRYILQPQFSFWSQEPYMTDGAKTVADGFQYDSKNNSDWLTPDGLRKMLSECGVY